MHQESVLSAEPQGRGGVLSREVLDGTQFSSCCSWIPVCLGRKAGVTPSPNLRTKTTEQFVGGAAEYGAVVILGGGTPRPPQKPLPLWSSETFLGSQICCRKYLMPDV